MAALVAMVLLSIAIYTANYVLGRFHRASVFSDSPDGVIDPEVQSSVRAVGVFAALLPWFGMLSGIFAALRDTIQRIDALKPAAAMGGGRAAYFSTEFSMVNFNDLGTFRTWLSNIEFIDQYWPAIGWVALIWLAIVLVWRLRKEVPALVVGPFISERSLSRPKLRSVNPRHPGAPPPRATSNPGARQRSPWRVSSRASYLAVVVIAIIVLAKLFMPAVLSHVAGDFSGGGVAPNGEVHVRAKSISEVIVGIGGIFLPSFLSPIEIWLTTMLIVSIPLVLACVSISRRAKSLTRRSPTLALVLWGVVGILACSAAACFAAGLITYNWIELSRLLGPLGLSVLLFLTIFALIAALSVAGRELGIPALFVLAGVAAAISLVKLEVAAWSYLVAAVLLIVAAISVYWRRPRAAFVLVCLVAMTVYGTITRTVANSTNQTVTKHAFGSLTELFQKWVAARERQIATYRAANGQRPYPVFVIAAEGGGIYAAAAVSTFLARMQEACPSFAQHIFAISAVSGGAVGSMAWHYALKAKRPEFAREGCIGAGGKGSIQNAIRKVIQADHLSPLAGLLVADVLGTYDDRARGLEWSLRRSIENNVRAIPRSEIAQLYQHHWDPKKP
ncbi:MAG: hypothetical protein KDJ36_09750, partial [Hyphomicrobiaceae bacterium]|nr:hypothetical protein [Hyphomicrobiaceae bacterium]